LTGSPDLVQPEERRILGLPSGIFWAALLALGIKVVLALRTTGTNDIRSFMYYLLEYDSWGIRRTYADEPEFNHPPFILHWLGALRWLYRHVGLTPGFWIRLPSILADFGSALVLGRLFADRLDDRRVRATVLLAVLAPVSIFVSGFHGNNDPVMIFFVLLSVFLLERKSPTWAAGLAMGMAVNMKIVPLVFWPAVFLWLPGLRRRAEYFGAAALAVVVASSPILFQEPALLARKVLGYRSAFGLWGLSRLASFGPESLASAYEAAGRYVLVAVLVALAFWMNLRAEKPRPFAQLGLLAFAFLAFSPGFGVQYLAWLVPWIAGAALAPASGFTVAATVFLGLVYTFWCQGVPFEAGDPDWRHAVFWRNGLPWDFANADTMGEWRGPMVPFEILCWLSVVVVFASKLRNLRSTRARGS
jgi:hypothetical protein